MAEHLQWALDRLAPTGPPLPAGGVPAPEDDGAPAASGVAAAAADATKGGAAGQT